MHGLRARELNPGMPGKVANKAVCLYLFMCCWFYFHLPYILKSGNRTDFIFLWGHGGQNNDNDNLRHGVPHNVPGLRPAGHTQLMDSFCSLLCSDIMLASISASKGGQKVLETWSTAWPTMLKLMTAATVTRLWCYSRKVPVESLGPRRERWEAAWLPTITATPGVPRLAWWEAAYTRGDQGREASGPPCLPLATSWGSHTWWWAAWESFVEVLGQNICWQWHGGCRTGQ